MVGPTPINALGISRRTRTVEQNPRREIDLPTITETTRAEPGVGPDATTDQMPWYEKP
jgi:hypothetical protein